MSTIETVGFLGIVTLSDEPLSGSGYVWAGSQLW